MSICILISCGSSSGSSSTYVNPHAQAHSQMHQELYQEELNKELAKKLEKISGTYSGNLPCTDCESIEFKLILNSDLTYTSEALYVGKSEDSVVKQGTFSVNENWKIKLDQNTGNLMYFQPTEGQLIVLDKNGFAIPGELGDQYILNPSEN
jgi:uncharacterized lipoprotein NlpE involved in copper resistance